jgi:hypothetical protein
MAPRDLGSSAHRYETVARALGVRLDGWSRGRVLLSATKAAPCTDSLRSLSELAMATACCSMLQAAVDLELRIGIIVLRTNWQGPLGALANAEPCPGRGWILDCELRAHDRDLVSMAFAHATVRSPAAVRAG